MSAAPFLSQVEQVRALKGEALVTYPHGDLNWPVTQRYRSGLPALVRLAFGSAEPDTVRFPGLVLTGQQELANDRQKVEMIHTYEKLPGPVLASSEYDAASGRVMMTTRQDVLTSTVPATADLLDAEINGYAAPKTVFSLVSGLVGCTAHGYSIGEEIIFGSLTLNSLSLTSVSTTQNWPIITCASTAGFHMGSVLVGTGIPAGCAVYRILSATSLEMTMMATATNTGLTLTSNEPGMTLGNTSGVGAYYVSSIPNPNSFYFTDLWGGSPNIYPTATGGGLVYKRTTPRGTTISYAPRGGSSIVSVRTVTTSPLLTMDFLHGAPDLDIPGNHPYQWPDVLVAGDYYAASSASSGGGYNGAIALKLGITEGPQGKSKALIRRRYTSNPAAPGFLDNIPPIQRWFKSAHSLAAVASFDGHADSKTFTVPATIHAAGNVGVVGDDTFYVAGGILDTYLTASYPPIIPPGWNVADVSIPVPEGHGLWRTDIILVRLF